MEEELFFDVLRTAIGSQKALSRIPSEEEWKTVYAQLERQSLVGIAIEALRQLIDPDKEYYANLGDELYFSWIGTVSDIQIRNTELEGQCDRLRIIFAKNGFDSVILKGLGVARYYGELACYRQSGDIDIWLWPRGEWTLIHDMRAKKIISYLKSIGPLGNPTYHNVSFEPFNDTKVEAHYTPSWLYSPMYNHRLQRWFASQAPKEMENEFSSIEFNLVYVLLHIYRHLLGEGIGLRQVIDYYFVLKQSDQVQRQQAFDQLKKFGAKRFAGALMWILHEKLALDSQSLLCLPDEKEGRFLLSEIMQAGNFGHADTRLDLGRKRTLMGGFVMHVERNLHFITHYPSEVLWCPFWKVWHQLWKRKLE